MPRGGVLIRGIGGTTLDEAGQYVQSTSQTITLPHRFVGQIYGPKGAQVHQRWHVGNLWQPNPAERWEDYRGYVVHTL